MLDGVGGQCHAPAALPPGKARYPLYRRLGRPPGRVWTGAENLAFSGIRSPDRPPRSESLYGLRYPGPRRVLRTTEKFSSETPKAGGVYVVSRGEATTDWPPVGHSVGQST